ncbi:uncharacterized protein [Equus caballus]|uniref:uncharacterized protein n=1 Tax=Equus caballus TaxID=9796 RepID=UPI0038B3BAD7
MPKVTFLGQAAVPPPQGPSPLTHTPLPHTPSTRLLHAQIPALLPLRAELPAPSLALAPPPAAEGPDGGSSRSARGPQTPPGSSRRSLPPCQLLQRRPGRSARRTGSSAGSDWGGSWAAQGQAGGVISGKEPCRPQVRKPRGSRVGSGELGRSGTTLEPLLHPCPSSPHHHHLPVAAGRAVAGQEHPRDSTERPRSRQEGAPSTLVLGRRASLPRHPPQPSGRLSRPERCPLLPESGASLYAQKSSSENGGSRGLRSFSPGPATLIWGYRYTRKTKAIQSPHLSSSLTVVPFLCCCFPCFGSSSYGRSRWLLIGGALWL